MRTPLSFIIVSSLLLSACGITTTSIDEQNKNPFVAARYGDELADAMANLLIADSPAAKDEDAKKLIQNEIERGKRMGDAARTRMEGGFSGPFFGIQNEVAGYALYLDNVVYISSDFYTRPGPALHAYLTTIADPTESGAVFPDNTAVDLGEVQSLYAAHQYNVPKQDKPESLRTLVLYDKKLKLVYGFAQLSKRDF